MENEKDRQTRPEEEAATRSAKRYAAGNYRLFFTGLGLSSLAVLGFIAFVSHPLADLARGAVAVPFLQVCIYAAGFWVLAGLVQLPLSFYAGYVREHRFGLSNQTVAGWLRHEMKGALLSLTLTAVLAVVLSWALSRFPHSWWLITAGIWLAFSLLLTRLAPILIFPLFYKSTPIEDSKLRERLSSIAAQAGLALSGLFKIDLSKTTRKMNAALAGIGGSRRVLLSDTLLERMNEDEIAVIFAHEIGHHARRHIGRIVVFQTLGSTLSLFLCSVIVGNLLPVAGISSLATLEALPVVGITLSVIGFIASPFWLAYSRRLEVESDSYAVENTGLTSAFISGMKKLAAGNLADESPSRLAEWFFFSHPPISRRIERAERYAAGSLESGGGARCR